MSNEPTQHKTGYNPLQGVLTPQQVNSLTQGQKVLLSRGLNRLVTKHGQENLTPAMILGQYELVTEHLLPSDMESFLRG